MSRYLHKKHVIIIMNYEQGYTNSEPTSFESSR